MHDKGKDNEFDINGTQGLQWVWDNQSNTLVLIEPHIERVKQRGIGSTASSTQPSKPSFVGGGEQAKVQFKVKFLDAIDPVEQLRFRRHHMRKTKPNEVDVITLQDIKDVVLFLLLTPIPGDFIKFFHTIEVDNFLRALILYFQYYLEIWHDTQYRAYYGNKRLKHPVGVVRENVAMEYLGELRTIVARDYSMLLLGTGSCKCYHHMANKQKKSIAERDLKLFEHLYIFSTRVVWIALNRQNLQVIEHEINRLFRSDCYNQVCAKQHGGHEEKVLEASDQSILHGNLCKQERQLFVRSPAIHEIAFDSNHPHELLQLGLIPVIPNTSKEKLLFFQDAYTLTEEYLEASNLSVGILGHSRDSYDPLLQPKEKLIGSVKRYVISSGLPRIFQDRLILQDVDTCNKEADTTSSTSPKDQSQQEKAEVEEEEEEEEEGEEGEEIQIIIRPKEFYKELHKQRVIVARRMWLKLRSLASAANLEESKVRKYSTNLMQ